MGSFGTPTLAIGNTLVTNRGGTAGYVAVLNTNGQPERVVPLVSEDLRWSSTSPNPVSVDEANNLIIVGRFSNDANGAALTLGGRTLTVDANQTVFFLASIAPDNTFNWLLSLGGGDLQFDGAVVTGLGYGGLIPGPGRSMLLNGHNQLDASIGNQSLPSSPNSVTSSAFLAKIVLPPLPPRLSIASNTAQLQLTWPTNATSFVLQSATTLANGGDWQDSGLTLTIVGDQNVVTVDTTGPSGFFRLHQP